MDKTSVTRGVDFESRFGESSFNLGNVFRWWRGGRLNKKSFLFILLVFFLNLFLISPISGVDLTEAYSSSALLMLFAGFIKNFLHLDKALFFSILTWAALGFAPISFYLFVRKLVLRHEVTALLATLLFILPMPFFYNTPILIDALLKGDGPHVFVLAFMPFFLLYVQSFISKGTPVLGVMSVVGIAVTAIISPFTFFNLIFFLLIIAVAESFQGDLRIKLLRLLFAAIVAMCLSAFWLYSNVVANTTVTAYFNLALGKFLYIFPLFIPAIPIAGALFFLIFDRREKLKPVFTSLSLFLIYLLFYSLSSNLNISGLFTADRYLPELSMTSSFFLAVMFVLLSELCIRLFMPKLKKRLVSGLIYTFEFFAAMTVGFLTLQATQTMRDYIDSGTHFSSFGISVGEMKPVFNLHDITSIIVCMISLTTVVLLMIILKKYPSLKNVKLTRRSSAPSSTPGSLGLEESPVPEGPAEQNVK